MFADMNLILTLCLPQIKIRDVNIVIKFDFYDYFWPLFVAALLFFLQFSSLFRMAWWWDV